ncbi:hypothetical protein OXB_2897 [Bacillus sp. OxB-1]|uniref:YqgU-like beta propeller domain-containing protein n=1 Tax=Bacillus sp. (strain OxB-1) TaxID=98228 RepID=UPI000581CEEA|nr:hypothetical protein [Bacillus sp. OxB-1]BAQ11368.1 hypothetical protein OXB_2897 [Bacillus sp. OxB-1]
MKKWLLALSIATTLWLAGCKGEPVEQAEESPVITEPPEQQVEEVNRNLHQLDVDLESFHFVADWLSDEEVVYVEKKEDLYEVKTFNMTTGAIETIYEDPSIIIDVLIHPSKEFLLIHTSDNPLSATVKILSMEGTVEDEIVVESSELGIEWNDSDPYQILLTAFHEDWSFDLFLYDGHENYLELVELEDPFPKWFGKNSIAFSHVEDHALDGGTIQIYDPATGNQRDLELSDIVYFDTYRDSLLVVRIDEKDEAVYTWMETDGTIRHQWKLPAVSNYSEWVISEIAWVADDELFLISPETGGLIDELQSPMQLIQMKGRQQKVVAEDVEAVLPRCSPSGKRCLTGFTSETLIHTETGEKEAWLLFP